MQQPPLPLPRDMGGRRIQDTQQPMLFLKKKKRHIFRQRIQRERILFSGESLGTPGLFRAPVHWRPGTLAPQPPQPSSPSHKSRAEEQMQADRMTSLGGMWHEGGERGAGGGDQQRQMTFCRGGVLFSWGRLDFWPKRICQWQGELQGPTKSECVLTAVLYSTQMTCSGRRGHRRMLINILER